MAGLKLNPERPDDRLPYGGEPAAYTHTLYWKMPHVLQVID